MDKADQLIYQFKSFLLNESERRLLNSGNPVQLTPKVFDALMYLVQNAGHLVPKNELMEAVWPGSFVEEVNIPRTIHTLRKALGQTQENIFIETVPTRGYRFVAPVTRIIASLPAGESGDRQSEKDGSETVGPVQPLLEPPITRPGRMRLFLAVPAVLLIAAAFFWLAGGERSIRPADRSAQTTSGEAYQHFQQGRLLVERRHKGDYEKALESFERAIALDPNYAAAYAAKADAKVVHFWGPSSSYDDISQARTAVKKALELDESSSYAHTIYCRILTTVDWDHPAAEKECRRAVELDPNDHEALKEWAFFLNSFGREQESLAAIDKAISVAPTSFNKRSRGLILYYSRRYDEAIEQLEQVDETDQNYKETTRWLMRAHEMKGDHQKALDCYLKLTERSGATADDLLGIRTSFEKEGWPAVLRHMTKSENRRTIFLAGAYAQLGERDKAFEALEEMVKRRAVLIITVAREPTLDPLRDDPRFAALLKRVGLN
ncbi:MAG: tetratricopeptide repeat protein [Pyrinomonadaceae bacterium]